MIDHNQLKDMIISEQLSAYNKMYTFYFVTKINVKKKFLYTLEILSEVHACPGFQQSKCDGTVHFATGRAIV